MTRKNSETSKHLDESHIKEEPTPGCYVKARYILAIMGFLGKFNMYAMRTNLSVAIVAMVNMTEHESFTNLTDTCPDKGAARIDETTSNGNLNWNTAEQGLALGAYFYGYIFMNVPGGYLAKRFGVRYVLGLTMLCSSIITILSPFVATLSLELFVALRIFLGSVQGVMSPALYAAWGKWAPPLERSNLLAISTSGGSFGTFATFPIAGLIASRLGWESVFYITGGIGIPWCVLWFILIYSSPEEHPCISKQEKTYIVRSIGEKKKDPEVMVRTPWCAIMTSVPAWAIMVANFSNNWGNNTSMTMFPTYLSRVLRFDLASSGFLAALPYVLNFILMLIGGYITDVIRKKRIVTTTVVRKVNTCLGLVVPGIMVIIVGYVGCDVTSAVALFTISVGFIAFCTPGCETNTVDIAPKYGGIIYGIANTIGNVSGFLAPQIIGFMLLDDGSVSQWQNVFWMTGAVYGVGAIIYVLFASGVEQSWAGGRIIERKNSSKDIEDSDEGESHGVEVKMI